MDTMILDALDLPSQEQHDLIESRCVVRLSTTAWATKKGVFLQKSLVYLKRKCQGFNILQEDVSQIGDIEVLSRIENLDSCPDGVYLVLTCDEVKDWETGYIEDYGYRLVPYEEEPLPKE